MTFVHKYMKHWRGHSLWPQWQFTSHSFTLTCAYQTWDGSVHLDVQHPFLLKPHLLTVNLECRNDLFSEQWTLGVTLLDHCDPSIFLSNASESHGYVCTRSPTKPCHREAHRKQPKNYATTGSGGEGGWKGNGAKHHKCHFLWDLVPCEYLNLSYKLGPMQQGISTVQCITVHSLRLVVLTYKCLCKKSLSNNIKTNY